MKIVHLLIGTLKIVSDSNEKSFVFPHIAIVTQGVVHIVRTHTKRGEGGRLSLVRIPSVFGNCDVIYHEGVPKDEKQCVHLRYGPGIEISRWRMNEQRHLQKRQVLNLLNFSHSQCFVSIV